MLRPLWLKSDRLVPLNDQIAVPVPSAWLQSPFECSARLRELGYNALLLGLRDADEPVTESSELHFEIPVLIKPHLDARGCPLDPKWRARLSRLLDYLCQRVPNMHAVVWESGLLDPSYSQHPDATQADLVREEMQVVEQAVAGRARLIFYVPAQQAKRQAGWIPFLCDEAGKDTAIAFSAVNGPPWQDHLPLHPFWEVLANSPDVSSTHLMPIVNLGMVGLGNGLWPCVPFDLFERCLARCVRHRFAGPIVLADQLPGKGGALECSLWMGAQGNDVSAELLAQKWLSKRRSDLEYEAWAGLMRKTREIAIEMRTLEEMKSNEHKRLLLESLAARLKFMASHYEAQDKSQLLGEVATSKASFPSSPTLFDYFTGFICEARTLLSFNAGQLGQTKVDDFWKSETGNKIRKENLFP